MALTYGQYLKIPELLSLQSPVSIGPDHDETLFIVIHQVYELWFKQQLHEGDYLGERLGERDLPAARATLKRMLTILKTMVAQIDVLETMNPIDFLSFRSLLQNASGFQSCQFREFEILLGNRKASLADHYPAGSLEHTKIIARLGQLSLWQVFVRFLAAEGHAIPASAFDAPQSAPTQACAEVADALLKLYRERSPITGICELLVDLDEGIQEWRYRHVKMVERTIGFRQGTGGSAGAEYLRQTLFRPLFPDLWEIRTRL